MFASGTNACFLLSENVFKCHGEGGEGGESGESGESGERAGAAVTVEHVVFHFNYRRACCFPSNSQLGVLFSIPIRNQVGFISQPTEVASI